jgi:hypothetical protein
VPTEQGTEYASEYIGCCGIDETPLSLPEIGGYCSVRDNTRSNEELGIKITGGTIKKFHFFRSHVRNTLLTTLGRADHNNKPKMVMRSLFDIPCLSKTYEYIVTYRPNARQRLDKHLPADTYSW